MSGTAVGVCRGKSCYFSDWSSSDCEICELWWTMNNYRSTCRRLYSRYELLLAMPCLPTTGSPQISEVHSSLAVKFVMDLGGAWKNHRILEENLSFCQLRNWEELKTNWHGLFQLDKPWSCSFPGLCKALICLQLPFMPCHLKSAGNPLLHSFEKLSVAKSKDRSGLFSYSRNTWFSEIMYICTWTVSVNLPEPTYLVATPLFMFPLWDCY